MILRFVCFFILSFATGKIFVNKAVYFSVQQQSTLSKLSPADVEVSAISFRSIVFDSRSKIFLIKVFVTIKNNADIKSPKTELEAYTKSPASGGVWKGLNSLQNVPVIEPGKTYSAEYTFKGSLSTIGSVAFDFFLKIDPKGLIAELDEINNSSKSIVINPRAY